MTHGSRGSTVVGVSIVILILICGGGCNLIAAEELREMEVTASPDGAGSAFVVRDPREAVLVVMSTIHPLSFESNMGVIRVDSPAPGEYRIHLFAGTNLVTVKADGYLPVRERFFFEPKSAISVRVSPRKRGAEADERPELKLKIDTGVVSGKIAGTIDGKILNLDFSSGSVLLRPQAGDRRINLVCGGKIWEKTYKLKNGDKVEDSVSFFSPAAAAIADIRAPGGLYITSPVASAKVFLNDVYQGLTPLTLDSVEAGKYELRLERVMFLPSTMEIEVKPLDYTAHEVRLVPNYGIVSVRSDPSGAVVKIEGIERGQTPVTGQRLSAGSYQISASRPYYSDRDTLVEISAGDTLDLAMVLSPKFGRLQISSTPGGALVNLDGRTAGFTPLLIDTVMAGEHSITLSAQHYFDLDEQVDVGAGEQVVRDFALKGNFGLLTIEATPIGATVVLEGEEQLTLSTPVRERMLIPGIYRLRIEQEGYEPVSDVVVMELNGSQTIKLDLERHCGQVKVSSSPQGATIYLDGVQAGVTPVFLHDVPTGRHTLRLDKPGFDLLEDTLTIKKLELKSLDVTLTAAGTKLWKQKRLAATIRSGIVPGWGEIWSSQPIRGTLWLTAICGALYMAVDADARHADYKAEYELEREEYYKSEIGIDARQHHTLSLEALENMNEQSDLHQLWLATAGGVYLLQLADTWFFSAGDRPKVQARGIEFGSTFEQGRVGLRAGCRFDLSAGGGK